MIADELGQQLHDKVTRGEVLSEEEKTWLENWYALQDQEESQALGLTNERQTLQVLQSQVETALTQLTIATRRIQEISMENETIRQDITMLRQQLADQVISHPAR